MDRFFPTMRQLLAITLLAMLSSSCGGGGGGGSGATMPPAPGPGPGTTENASASCATSTGAGQNYLCSLRPIDASTRFSLQGAPEGMAVHPRSGRLYWTPMPAQQGRSSVTIIRTSGARHLTEVFALDVGSGSPAANGIYISPIGDDSQLGTAQAPLRTLAAAVSKAGPGDTLYLRGGDYYNDEFGTDFSTRSRNNLARITSSGTAGMQITIRPHGNEYVRLISDVNGLAFRDARHWKLQNLELMGTAASLDVQDSLSLWWDQSDAQNQIQGRGISLNSSYNIEISGCVIHHFPGAGVSNNGGAYITVADSVIYNNAWWSTAGTHGFANSSPATEDNTDTQSFKVIMRGNLVFGNQSSMISHVFSKGVVKLEIDEGNGLHMQNNGGNFFGRFLAEQNLSLLNGKAGLGLNTVDNSVIRNNAFYANAQAVVRSGELVLQSSSSQNISQNLFHALPARNTIRTSDTYAGVGSNYAVASADTAELPASITQVSAVFADPANGDFSRSASVPAGNGPDDANVARFHQLISEQGLTLRAAPTVVTPAYLRQLRARILQDWPAPDPQDDIPENLILEDPDSGYCYRYADRMDYPGPPSSGTVCR